MGTWTAGKPVVGEKNWLLSPCGVPRSPIGRGGLLQGRVDEGIQLKPAHRRCQTIRRPSTEDAAGLSIAVWQDWIASGCTTICSEREFR